MTIESGGSTPTYKISPNPAGSTITISVNEEQAYTKERPSFTSVTLTDASGVVRKKYQYAKGTRQVNINVADLRPGIYYVEVGNGRDVQRLTLVVGK